jgi:hypothetical protein
MIFPNVNYVTHLDRLIELFCRLFGNVSFILRRTVSVFTE